MIAEIWNKAKKMVTQSQGLTSKDGNKYWRQVFATYARMGGKKDEQHPGK